jgi:hypothetical protein
VYYELPVVYTHQLDCNIELVGVVDTIITYIDGCQLIEVIDYAWVPEFSDVVEIQTCKKRLDGATHVRDTLVNLDGCWGIVDSFFVYTPDIVIGFDTTCDATLNGTLSHILTVATDSCDIAIHVYWNALSGQRECITEVICDGEAYLFDSTELSISGVYQRLSINQFGCPDTLELTLVVLPSLATSRSEWVCPGDSVFWNGRYFGVGSYTDFFTSWWGCDSVSMLTVQELPDLLSAGLFTEDTIMWEVTTGTDVAKYFETKYSEREFVIQWLLGDSSGVHSVLYVDDGMVVVDDSTRLYTLSVRSDSLLCANYSITQVWRVRIGDYTEVVVDTCKVFVAPNPITGLARVYISGVRDYISLDLQDITGHSVWAWSAGSLGTVPTSVPLPSSLPTGLYWLVISVPELPEQKRNWAIQILYL